MLDNRVVRIAVQGNLGESQAGAAKNNGELDCSSMIVGCHFGQLGHLLFLSSVSLFYCWTNSIDCHNNMERWMQARQSGADEEIRVQLQGILRYSSELF